MGVTVVLKKRIDLSLALVLENRAGAVKQNSARHQLGPQLLQKTRLRLKETPDVVRSSEPTDVWVPPHNA